MEKQEAILQHKIRSIDDKIYDLIQEKKQLQNELDLLGVILATHDKELDVTLVDSDINNWSEEKKVYFELVGKLNEPERSEALSKYDEKFFISNTSNYNLKDLDISTCLSKGIRAINLGSNLIKTIVELHNNTYQFDRI